MEYSIKNLNIVPDKNNMNVTNDETILYDDKNNINTYKLVDGHWRESLYKYGDKIINDYIGMYNDSEQYKVGDKIYSGDITDNVFMDIRGYSLSSGDDSRYNIYYQDNYKLIITYDIKIIVIDINTNRVLINDYLPKVSTDSVSRYPYSIIKNSNDNSLIIYSDTYIIKYVLNVDNNIYEKAIEKELSVVYTGIRTHHKDKIYDFLSLNGFTIKVYSIDNITEITRYTISYDNLGLTSTINDYARNTKDRCKLLMYGNDNNVKLIYHDSNLKIKIYDLNTNSISVTRNTISNDINFKYISDELVVAHDIKINNKNILFSSKSNTYRSTFITPINNNIITPIDNPVIFPLCAGVRNGVNGVYVLKLKEPSRHNFFKYDLLFYEANGTNNISTNNNIIDTVDMFSIDVNTNKSTTHSMILQNVYDDNDCIDGTYFLDVPPDSYRILSRGNYNSVRLYN